MLEVHFTWKQKIITLLLIIINYYITLFLHFSTFLSTRWSEREKWAVAGFAQPAKTMNMSRMSSRARRVNWAGGLTMNWKVGLCSFTLRFAKCFNSGLLGTLFYIAPKLTEEQLRNCLTFWGIMCFLSERWKLEDQYHSPHAKCKATASSQWA